MSFPPFSTEYGNDCLLCYPAGLTPKYLYVGFSEIQMGDNWAPGMIMPPNDFFVMTQTVANPCVWQASIGPNHYVRYTTAPGFTVLLYVFGIAKVAFTSTPAAHCIKFHVNGFAVPAGNYFYDGLAYVFTPEEIQLYWEKYTPLVDPDPQMNVHPVSGNRIVIQYTDDWGDTNVKMLLDLNP